MSQHARLTSVVPARLIAKKRDGEHLTSEEIHAFIQGVMKGEITDYQLSAFLMAVFFRGMSAEETVALTEAMIESGDRYDLSLIPGEKADKHSTGGVGDKVSIILAPLAAACGLKVPMMAGRGLGHTGGTVDKLEAIPGYQTQVESERFKAIIKEVGCAIVGQSAKIAPADKKLYAIRDVTGTIECIPLITASILSKKFAEGTGTLILDIKVGNGAFMKSREQARKLSKAMLQVGKKLGLNCRVMLTDMSQPLGYSAGNTIEVIECIEILKNEKGYLGPDLVSLDLKEITIQLCAEMLHAAKLVKTTADGRKLASKKLQDGTAWTIFKAMVKAQGGSVEHIENWKKLPLSSKVLVIKAPKSGVVNLMDTEKLGWALVEIGGGRKKVTDIVDPSVGVLFHKKLGAKVKTGDALFTVYLPEKSSDKGDSVKKALLDAITISGTRKPVPKLIIEISK